MFAGILGAVAKAFGAFGSNLCLAWLLDEPECPKSLVK